MRKGNWSRRGFLEASTIALTTAGLPLWFARETIAREAAAGPARKFGPNDQIVMGAIGTGDRGTGIMREVMRKEGVKMVAVCDVDREHAQKAADHVGNDCKIYKDFRELLARDDIDAVTIGTPDQWHALIAIEAAKQGKDIYCEKPLTLFLDEGKAVVKAVQANDVVFQTGSQQRSDRRFRLACELVRNGRIGKIKTVEARIGANPQGGPFKEEPVPEHLDWDFWLGPTPEVAYIPERCHYEYRWWKAYSGGKMTDWGAHHNDTAQWGLGYDDSGPIEVNAMGDAWPVEPNCYDMPEHFVTICKYDNGATLYTMSDPRCRYAKDIVEHATDDEERNGVLFTGEDGWIFVNRSKIMASDERLLEEPLSDDATRLYVSDDHMQNFVDCVRDRQKPICDEVVGHRSVSVCHLQNIALNVRRELKWDPKDEKFIDDDDANKLLSREMRDPWKLEV